MSWIVKMWHFGKDASICYSCEKFDMLWKYNLSHFIIFTKKIMKEKEEELRR